MNKRLQYISFLNVFASFSVVMLHNNGIIWEHPIGKTWISAIFIETLFYSAVPLFFMISGVTLIDYKRKYSTSEFISKRFYKTVIPFLFWSLFGILYLCIKYKDFTAFSFGLNNIISNILNTRSILIYWFFIPLFSVYLCIPILSEIKDKITTFKYMIIIYLLFFAFLPFVCQLFNIEYNYEIIPKFVYGYVIYSITGYFIANNKLSRNCTLLIYIMGGIGFFSNFLGTALLTKPGGRLLHCLEEHLIGLVIFRHLLYLHFS